jgi:hypothetical protein
VAATSEGTVARRRPGNRPAITSMTLRVRRLTLAPTSLPVRDEGRSVEDDAVKILDRERMARVVAFTTTTGACHRRLDSRHSVEPGPWSCFWVIGEDEDESEDDPEEDDNTLMPVLIREAMQAGFLIEQLRQAEEELA